MLVPRLCGSADQGSSNPNGQADIQAQQDDSCGPAW